jgi:hypothetical protein
VSFADIADIDLDLLHSNSPVKRSRQVPLYLWPPPEVEGKKRGPNPKQLVLWKWGHLHPKSIDVLLGAARSGKTLAVVARCLWTALKFPGAIIVVGSMDFEHLKNTIINDFKERLSIKEDWDHPVLKKGKKLSREHKDLEFKNGSIIRFVNLNLFIKTLGMKADMIVIEEAPTLKDEEMLDLLLGRLSGMRVPFKQVILTGNPMKSLGWMVPRFHLYQFDKDYEGQPVQIGKPCSCQYCLLCKKRKLGNFERVNGVCPVCGYKNKSDCPGNQNWHRVIQFYPEDNDHVPDTLDSDNEASMDSNAYKRMGGGQIIISKTGACYPHLSAKNLLSDNHAIDPNKDLIWTLDFNHYPECSVICQEYEGTHPVTGNPTTEVLVLDEIVEWKATEKKVARKFIAKFKDIGLKGKVRIFGDPAAFNNAVVNEDDDEELKEYDKFVVLVQELEKAGFDVELCARHTVYLREDRITNVNFFLDDGDGYNRVKINPAAKHLIASLKGVTWDPNGKKEWEEVDRRAKRSGDWDKVHVMTHPSCAFGYYLIEAHPMFPTVDKVPYIQNMSTGEVTELGKNGVEKFFVHEREGEYEFNDLDIEELEELSAADYSVARPSAPGLFRMSDLRGL